MWQVECGQVEGVAVAYPSGQILCYLNEHSLPVPLIDHLVCLGPAAASMQQQCFHLVHMVMMLEQAPLCAVQRRRGLGGGLWASAVKRSLRETIRSAVRIRRTWLGMQSGNGQVPASGYTVW
eukprot:GHUV01031804.1.p2 GENE.GHUV01031804.1~~GHUV01031804.1.p2  ORF type:complete len:122 (-),score=1.85 GHUV01031804.1:560-925(-)